MGLKENIQAVQEEISTEEQFLEGMIKGERFFKRNKKYIIVGLSIVVLGVAGYAINDLLSQQRLKAANAAYQTLMTNANDQNALTTLQQKNPKLYTMFLFEQALSKNDLEALKTVAASKDNNPILADIAGYQLAQLDTNSTHEAKSELLKNMVLLQEGYQLLQDNKIEEARLKLAQIDANSPLKQVAKNLEHYQGLK